MSADERGVSTGFTALLGLVVLVVCGILGAVGIVEAARLRADRAADLAAVAASDAGVAAGCEHAEQVARANGTGLSSCRFTPAGVAEVEVQVALAWRWPGAPSVAVGRARAVRT